MEWEMGMCGDPTRIWRLLNGEIPDLVSSVIVLPPGGFESPNQVEH